MVGPYRPRPPYGTEPYGPPSRQWTRPGYGRGYLPPRPPRRRRSAATTAAGALGGFATLCVVAVLGYTLAGAVRPPARQPVAGAGPHPGSREAAVDSPLYRTGPLGAAGCRLPKIRAHDDDSMLAFLGTLSDCLDTVWGRQFTKAGLAGFAAPRRVFWDVPGGSPCGSYPAPGAAAFYCPANDTLYVGLADVVAASGGEPLSHYAVYARIVAHEYGHHVQEDAGILEYGHRLMAAGTLAARDGVSRRIELQAQCFAGAFLSAERGTLPMTAEQYRAVLADARARGEDAVPPDRRDHGSGRHYAGWIARGYTGRALSSCDTWIAARSDVS